MNTWILIMVWWAFSDIAGNTVTVPGLPTAAACEQAHTEVVRQVRPWKETYRCLAVAQK